MSQPLDPQKQAQLLAQIKKIEEEISQSTETTRARLYNQAGDIYTQLGQSSDALAAYGKSINGYIEAGQASVANALCVKMIRRYPSVVRAHFTLACLALQQGLAVEAMRALEAYAAAAAATSTTPIAIPRLRFLAKGVADPTVREGIARLLDGFGDHAAAQSLRTTPPRPLPPGSRLFLDAATWDSDAMWASFWME